MYVNRRG